MTHLSSNKVSHFQVSKGVAKRTVVCNWLFRSNNLASPVIVKSGPRVHWHSRLYPGSLPPM
ncbi:putative carbamoyl-phosphate synthase large chain, partial [Danaus plexippus plexippus]